MKTFKKEGFTVIELLVVIAITAILSAIILFSITQYVDKGRDASISSNLVILIPAGEKYYDAHGRYKDLIAETDFCDSDVVANSFSAIGSLSSNRHCVVNESGDRWFACAQLSNPATAYCVDSTGVKKQINNTDCVDTIVVCP